MNGVLRMRMAVRMRMREEALEVEEGEYMCYVHLGGCGSENARSIKSAGSMNDSPEAHDLGF